MTRRIAIAGLVAGLALAANVARSADAPETLTAQLVDQRPLVGALRSMTSLEITLGAGRPLRVPTRDVIRLDFPDRPRLPSAGASLIQLVNGDRIVAGLSGMSDENLDALWKSYPDWLRVRIPTAAIAGIVMAVPESPVQRSRAFAQIASRREKRDVVLLQNGDRAAGDLLSFDQATLKLSQEAKPLQIELERVRGVAFNSQLSSLPEPKKPRVQITLTDGSVLTGWSASREEGGPLRMTTAFGAALQVPLPAISTIRFLDGRATYLSDLEPSKTDVAGFFGRLLPAAVSKNRNAGGGPIVVRGLEYSEGLGTRSYSRITFELGGRYRRFQSWAALDDLAEGKGSVRFAVEVDAARVFTSDIVTGTSPPLFVGPIDVASKSRLTLIVEYGQLADISDWADWCDALLLQ